MSRLANTAAIIGKAAKETWDVRQGTEFQYTQKDVREQIKWLQGPVFNSLPLPIQNDVKTPRFSLTNTFTALNRYKEIERYRKQQAWPADEQRSLRIACFNIAVTELGAYFAVPALEHLPGFGEKYAMCFSLALHELIIQGRIPGEVVLGDPILLQTVLTDERIVLPGTFLKRVPPRKHVKQLREWWLENGGNA